MARHYLALAVLLLASCADEPSAEEQARIDAEVVARVEQANDTLPPLIEIEPGIIAEADMVANTIEGARCTYMPGTNGSPRFIARSLDGFMKLDGRVIRLAADSGSLELAEGTRRIYNGRAYRVQLEMTGGEGSMVVHDAYGRVAFAGSGPVNCEAGEQAPDNPEVG